jgi:hypothetical protein
MVRYDIITRFLFAFAFCPSSQMHPFREPVPLTANCLIKTDHNRVTGQPATLPSMRQSNDACMSHAFGAAHDAAHV